MGFPSKQGLIWFNDLIYDSSKGASEYNPGHRKNQCELVLPF